VNSRKGDGRTKNKRPACQPLPGDVAEAVHAYLQGRDPDAPLWPRKKVQEIAVALRHDLEAAHIAYTVDGPEGPLFFDFHSLRHSYVLMLDRSGATLKEAMQLARHSDPKLTMARFGRVQLHDLGAAVERLPSLLDDPARAGDTEALQATGTDGNYLPPGSPLAHPLAQASDAACGQLRSFECANQDGAGSASGLQHEKLRPTEGGCKRVMAGDESGEKEETPGDRRRALLYRGRVGAWTRRVRLPDPRVGAPGRQGVRGKVNPAGLV
jgi:hypothetical protein